MLKYRIDVINALKEHGYSAYRIRKENLLPQSAMQYFREGKVVGPQVLDKICSLLQLQPGDIIEHIPD